MGLHVGRLLLLLLCLFSLPSLSSAASFQGCFPGAPLARFWQSPPYISGNPNIITIWSIHSYSFEFDNSSQSLGLENISIMNGSLLLSRVPASERSEFSESAALLTRASSELALAKEAMRSSHSLSAKAQAAVRDNFGLLNAPLGNVFFLNGVATLGIIMKVADLSAFVSLYPAQYSSALEHASSAHDSLQSSALSLSILAQSEYEFLSKAGAGSLGYSGAASTPFNYAESLLAPEGGFCAGEAAAYQKAYDYFASSPQMPDFSQAGFPSRLASLGGAGENSSIARALSLYLLLSEAKGSMLAEYSTARLSAQDASRALTSEISLLGNEKLELIGDAPPSSANGTSLVVGSSYAGIYSGYLNAKEDMSRAQSLTASSQASFSSKDADGWLYQAISEAQSSAEISQTALASLKLVRSNAESAVLSQKAAAEGAIASAQLATSAPAISFASAKSISSARSILSQAEGALASAASLPSLGERYAAYAGAARLAMNAQLLSESQQETGALLEAEQAISAYKSLLSAASADGIDVSYERETVSQYLALVRSSPQSPDILSSVISAVESDRQSVLLKIRESYSYLEEKYARASELTGAMRASAPLLSQKLSGVAAYFPSGALDAARAAGRLKQAERDLNSIISSLENQLPQYLSSALSQNSHVSEIYGMPVLGMLAGYTAYITAQNPSPLQSPGAVPFQVRTSVPLYSSDFSDGDMLSDAYPNKSKTTIIVPSVAPLQSFSFTFAKKDQPAQVLSSEDSCSFATGEAAQASRAISFISSRALPSLLISQPAPLLSHSATAKYAGQAFPLSPYASGDEGLLQGEISGVAAGEGKIDLSYEVPSPFTTSLSEREYETLPLAGKKVSYTLSLSPPLLDCPAATVLLHEPYASITNLSVTPLSGEKVARAAAAASGGETEISIAFSPLTKGKQAAFSVSYVLLDASQALSDALSQAELMVLTYNRTKDSFMLSEAKSLALQGKDNEALSILSRMRKEAQELSYSAGDYRLYLQEKSESGAMLSSLLQTQASLLLSNSSSHAAFSSALIKYKSSLSSAADEADAGGYQKAVSIARKAKTDISSALAALSLSSLKSASEAYAGAQKAGGDSALLQTVQGELSGASASYTQGDFAQSILHSSAALSRLSSLSQASEASASETESQAGSLRSDYASLRTEVEALLANYSSQYAALSTVSRRQLPFTPSAANTRLSDADKLLSASKKSALSPQDALSQANSSLVKLSSLRASLSDSLASLSSLASTSLDVARAALSEVESRAGAEDAQQIGAEVARAEEFLANAMYADSLSSSSRAVSAANTALLKAGDGGGILQPAALAIVSILFLAGAAYYFFSGKKRSPPSEKKEVPKAE